MTKTINTTYKTLKTRTRFSDGNICHLTSLNRHNLEVGRISNFSLARARACVVDRVRGCSVILVFLWSKIKDWVSVYLLHLRSYTPNFPLKGN